MVVVQDCPLCCMFVSFVVELSSLLLWFYLCCYDRPFVFMIVIFVVVVRLSGLSAVEPYLLWFEDRRIEVPLPYN